eukprot:8662090-Ditylum_brightwellii.AAC.1
MMTPMHFVMTMAMKDQHHCKQYSPPNVKFEETAYAEGRIQSAYSNASKELDQLERTTERLRGYSDLVNSTESDTDSTVGGILSLGHTADTYCQENVLPTGEFDNMDTTHYS